jgi:hypothetical protein
MSDISSQLIKDSYNYVLQSDVSTGNIYRIGGGIPVNPIFLSGLTINGELNATTISSGPVIIKSNNNDQLLLTTTNYNSGSDGNILYFYTQTGITYSNISARTNGGSSNADLVLQESIGSNVGIGKVPSSIYKLDVNGAIGATSISATTITTPFSGGSVLFAGTSGQISQNNSQLFWDNTNNRLGVNNPSPFTGVSGTVNGLDIGIYNSAGNEGNLTVRGFASLGGITRSSYGAVGSNYYLDSANALRRRVADSVSVIDFASGGFLFKTSGNAAINTSISLTELMRINANGNVLIGTTTDSGYKFEVNGTARFAGNIITRFITVETGYQISAPVIKGRVAPFEYGNTYTFGTSTDNVSSTATGGTRSSYIDHITWQQSSGNAEFTSFRASPTINQTGTATGTTRGLYINPTLTSSPDFRAIETTRGNVILGSTSGNTLIGTSVDSGFKLNVSGNTNITGGLTATTISATTYQGIPKTFGAVFDNGGSVILSGTQVDVIFNNTVILNSWTMIADTTGSTVVDIWKDTYANYPPTSSDTIITGGTKPNISSDIKNQSSSLSGWNTIINSGDIVRFNVDTCSSITKLTLSIYATQI